MSIQKHSLYEVWFSYDQTSANCLLSSLTYYIHYKDIILHITRSGNCQPLWSDIYVFRLFRDIAKTSKDGAVYMTTMDLAILLVLVSRCYHNPQKNMIPDIFNVCGKANCWCWDIVCVWFFQEKDSGQILDQCKCRRPHSSQKWLHFLWHGFTHRWDYFTGQSMMTPLPIS